MDPVVCSGSTENDAHSILLNNTQILVFICNCVLSANDIAQQMSRYDDGVYHIYECVFVNAFMNTGNMSLINMNNSSHMAHMHVHVHVHYAVI